MKSGVDIDSVARQVRMLASWPIPRISYDKPLKEKLMDYVTGCLEGSIGLDFEELDGIRFSDIDNPRIENRLRFNDGNVHFLKNKEVNEFLVPEYFYSVNGNFKGDIKFLLGEVGDYERIRINDKEVDVFVVVDELVSTFPSSNLAFANPGRGVIAARKQSIDSHVRELICDVGRVFLLDAKPAPGDSLHRFNLLSDFLSCFGFEEEDFSAKDLLQGPEMREKKNRVVGEQLKVVLAHEKGHFLADKYLDYDTFLKAILLAIANGDKGLYGFVHAVNESLADTLEEGGVEGRIPYVLGLDEPERSGFLYPACYGQRKGSLGRLLSVLEQGLLPAFQLYDMTGDIGVLKEACSTVCERSKSIAGKLCDAENYKELKQVQADFEKGCGVK